MKYKYNIKNLDCANCAKTIENKLNEDKNSKKAIVNFNSSTVTVETDLKDAFTYIKEIVLRSCSTERLLLILEVFSCRITFFGTGWTAVLTAST